MPISRAIVEQVLQTSIGERAYALVEKLTDEGFDTWWVGGCVRDMLLGAVPKEIDIGTSATPAEVLKLFSKTDAKGAPFGSIVVTYKTHPFEVTTFREDDAASDGRRPEAVSFGTRQQDAARRDFTINALYFHPIRRELFDPFEGEKDLNERLIRFIGDPGIRIKHDALRLLRAVRFRATIDGQYHPETFRALDENAQLVEILSGVRFLEELEKILLGLNPSIALEDLWELRILSYVIPELYACKGVAQPRDYHHEGDVWEHAILCTKAFTEEHGVDVRLAALFHDIGKAKTFALKERIRFDEHASVSAELTAQILARLQCPRKRLEKITWLIRHHMMMGSFSGMSDERKAHWYFHPWFPELLQLMWLDIAGTEPAGFSLLEEIFRDYHHFLDTHPRPPKPLLSGEEVMELLALGPGEKVGEVLKALHDAQVRKEIKTKAEAKAFLQKRQADSD